MTEQKKRRLQTKLQEARYRLMDSQPMFALLLMYLKFVSVDDMKKISTNGRCIFFSPEYVDKLYIHELDFVLCHVLMHIVTGDIWRERDLCGDDYHLACDIQNNALMMQIGFPETRYPHLGAVQYKVPGNRIPPEDLNKDQIKLLLPFSLYMFEDRIRNKYLPDNDYFWNDKSEWSYDGTLILDEPDISTVGVPPDYAQIASEAKKLGLPMPGDEDGDGKGTGLGGQDGDEGDDGNGSGGESSKDGENEGEEDLRQVWQGRIAAAEKIAEAFAPPDGEYGSLAGVIPGHMKLKVDKIKTKQIDWKKVLQEYLQEVVSDYSFSPPDRRFADTEFFLPDFNETDFEPMDVLFMVDTSGSIDRKSLSVAYGEIRSAIEQFSNKLEGKLGFFDTEVSDPIPFSRVSDIDAILPQGGGGTDFVPIFEYVERKYRTQLPSCVVIFTDGFGPFPEEKDIPRVPVLWLINNNEVNPPFGRVARIETHDEKAFY